MGVPQTVSPEGLLGRFGGQVLSLLKISLLGDPWGDLAAESWKCANWVSWGSPGSIWWGGHRSAQTGFSVIDIHLGYDVVRALFDCDLQVYPIVWACFE